MDIDNFVRAVPSLHTSNEQFLDFHRPVRPISGNFIARILPTESPSPLEQYRSRLNYTRAGNSSPTVSRLYELQLIANFQRIITFSMVFAAVAKLSRSRDND